MLAIVGMLLNAGTVLFHAISVLAAPGPSIMQLAADLTILCHGGQIAASQQGSSQTPAPPDQSPNCPLCQGYAYPAITIPGVDQSGLLDRPLEVAALVWTDAAVPTLRLTRPHSRGPPLAV
ncbi:MAG: DUF2946 family protein [Hyphomicrobiaceae bacterium]